MRQYTTPEQTAKLIELGFAPPQIYVRYSPDGGCWADYTLGELIEMLPTKIMRDGDPCLLCANISYRLIDWRVFYVNLSNGEIIHSFLEGELIDALYEMCIMLKENGWYENIH